MNEMLEKMGQKAKDAETVLRNLSTGEKNAALEAVAAALVASTDEILEANAIDVKNGRENHMPEGLIDRLMLDKGRIGGLADGLRQLVGLEDPIGEVIGMKKRPNGLLIGQKRVPLGVVGIIYEARPNVTSDAFGLCFKTGNVVILKGGSDAIHSNTAIVDCIRRTLEENGITSNAIQLIADTSRETAGEFMKMNEYVDVLIPRGGRDAIHSNTAVVKCIREALRQCGITENAIQLIEDTSRETAAEFMKLNQYVDVLIPRGGKGLIRAVVDQSTIPVIETGTGNCHIYVDETADLKMAADIVINAKTQRVGVCNACESLLVNRRVKDAFLPILADRLKEKHVEVRGDEDSVELMPGSQKATEEDWGTEYLDYIISVKVVDSVEDAIAHINRYNTGHSEAIITNDYTHAQKFLDEVDAAAVYVNASTRFTDGNEFGFGAEIGISTQKLHARGPMGLLALTTTKYIIYGNGQIRP